MSKSYAIIEDHTLFAQALELLVSTIQHFERGKVFSDPVAFLDSLQTESYDVVFVDLNMPKMNGIDLILTLRKSNVSARILVVSMINDPMVIAKALDAGADGYVPKNTRFDELKSALNCIDSGRIFVPEDMQFAVESARSLHDQNWETRNTDAKISILSARELEIVKLVAAGLNNAAIGEKLFLSPLTVKTHRANILRKLGLKNAIALVQYANAMNL